VGVATMLYMTICCLRLTDKNHAGICIAHHVLLS
jgi:hypothetical protein